MGKPEAIKKKIRVLFFIASSEGAGVQRVASMLTLHLSKDIERVTLFLGDKVYPFNGRVIRINNPLSKGISLFKKVKTFLFMLNKLSQAIKEERPDIVMGFTESTNSLILFYIFKEKIPIIATMGRLDPMKGQIYLLRALARIKGEIQCRLLILGEGGEKKKLEDQARNLEIKDDVLFLGFKKNPFKYLAHSDIFVFPSLMEAFPNALIEAMACGLPVISFDCPSGPSEILGNNEYGLLIPLKDEDRLVEAITLLLKDKEMRLYYKHKAQKRVKDFSISHLIPSYEGLFNETIFKA